ncbi:MAG: energy transducer TonB [Ferruginibacter sp.]
MKKIITYKKIIFAITLLIINYTGYAQEIVNIIYVGDNGITEDIKAANAFILIKQSPGGSFERLDYKLSAPLVMLRTYSDTNMSILNGKFLKYYKSGELEINGQYNNNQKDGDWLYYNEKGKIISKETYSNNTLIRKENPDTVKKENSVRYDDEKEAEFAGGKMAWNSYLQNALLKMPAELFPLKGKIEVGFMINTEGQTTEIYLKKSAQFAIDEEALKIIRLSALWNPAFQNGHAVNAYRVQPFTFAGEN